MARTPADATGQAHASPAARALPTPCAGFNVAVYAHVDEPMKLSFGPDGALYAGRQGGDRIHRIGPGGSNIGPSSGTGFVFGPDKALYVSEYDENRILKISRGGGGEAHCRPRP